jgi:hypothetical protein
MTAIVLPWLKRGEDVVTEIAFGWTVRTDPLAGVVEANELAKATAGIAMRPVVKAIAA